VQTFDTVSAYYAGFMQFELQTEQVVTGERNNSCLLMLIFMKLVIRQPQVEFK
jgi:hypothetical protein